LELHYGKITLEIPLKQYSNERQVKKIKKLMSVALSELNRSSNILRNWNYFFQRTFKVSKILDTSPTVYRLRDKKDEEHSWHLYEH